MMKKVYELVDEILEEFELRINSLGYVPVEEARNTIYAKLKEKLGISEEEARKRRLFNPVWWVFKEFCDMYYTPGNGDERSGIYRIDPAKVRKNLERYSKDIEKRLPR